MRVPLGTRLEGRRIRDRLLEAGIEDFEARRTLECARTVFAGHGIVVALARLAQETRVHDQTTPGRHLVVETRFLRKPGQSDNDPVTGEYRAGAFESSTRFEILDPSYK